MNHPQPIEAPGDSVRRRLLLVRSLTAKPEARRIELELCRRSVHRFFDNFVWTFDPRRIADRQPAHIPLDLFPRQREMLDFLDAKVSAREDGLIEKSRDIGFTWVAGGWALHKWIFVPGFKSTFASRKGTYVDRLGDPDSIFEKIRMILRGLPKWVRPPGFDFGMHDLYMRMINPANGNTISGEAGDDIGRGGRSSVYIIDEAAHLERGDKADASTSGNTDCRIWASSVNGMGNTFARKRHGGMLRPDQIFRFHYSDDPRKSPEWAAKKRASMEEHQWAAEYDIDYTASVEGICILGKWVEASIRLGTLIRPEPAVNGIGGSDIGAGRAKSVFVARFGPIVLLPVAWGDPDTIDTANRLIDEAAAIKLQRADTRACAVRTLNYDSVGVGRGVQSALRHSSRKPKGLITNPVNTGDPPTSTVWPDGETSEEKFANLKAELWWTARARLKAAYELLLHMEGKAGGHPHPVDEVVILPPLSAGPDAQILAGQLSLPKWFRNEKGKILIERKEQLAARGIQSPDHADAFVLSFAPASVLDQWTAIGRRRR